MSQFVKSVTSHDTVTENLAVSHSTSQDAILDYFFNSGNNRGRPEYEVAGDMASIFSQNQLDALKLVFYNRMITRKEKTTEKVQKGQGQRDEFVKSLAWLENNYPDLLEKNIGLIPRIGCWKDFFYDSAYTGYYHYVNTAWVFPLIKKLVLEIGGDVNLLAKYLPKIRSASNTKNDRHRRLNKWAKSLCNYLHWTPENYRRFKSDPFHFAHEYQRQMCRKEWDSLNFDKIPGKALFNLVNRKGKDGNTALSRHNLENKYLAWIKEKPVAKFTGYVYELYKAAGRNRSLVQKYTLDAQFNQLIEQAKKDTAKGITGNVWCALDTSGSMVMQCAPNLRAIEVCVSLGLFFSTLNEGTFKDHVVMFSSLSRVLKLTGSFCDKVDQINRDEVAWGGTNFQSVIDEIVRVRQSNSRIPVKDFPETLLVVSDMQFNSTGSETNYESCMRKLTTVGLPPIKVIWWNVNSEYGKDYPSQISDEGTTLISGFDPTVIQLILGGEQEVVDKITGERRQLTPREQMDKALNQELLNRIVV